MKTLSSKQFRFALSLCILAQVVLLTSEYRQQNGIGSLPMSQLSTLESGVQDDIRQMEYELDYGSKESWIELAKVYTSYGLLPNARYAMQRASEFGELDDESTLLYGTCLSRLGELDEARKYFQELADGRGEYRIDAWVQIGLDYLRAEQPIEARDALMQAGQDSVAELALSRLLLHMGHADQALNTLDSMIRRNPDSMRAHQMKGWALEALDRVDEAQAAEHYSSHCSDTVTIHTVTRKWDEDMLQKYGAAGHLMQSELQMQKGNIEAAINTMRESIKDLQPLWRPHYTKRLAMFYSMNGQGEEAAKQLASWLVHNGESAVLWEMVGDAWSASNQPAKAMNAWFEAIRYRGGQQEEVIVLLRVHQKLADELSRQGRSEITDYHVALAKYEEARINWRDDRVSQAVTGFEAVTVALPEFADAWYYLGESRYATGDMEGARTAFTRCLELNQNYGRASEGLQRLE